MEANGHAHETTASTESVKPIVVTKFERLEKEYDYCDHAEGFFTRDPYFIFEVYLADVPGKDTYKGTRISEIYIKCKDGVPPSTQWTWHSACREEPGWEYGERLFADFRAGIEPAIRSQTSNNMQYCTLRIDCLVDQLVNSGIDRAVVVSAMRESLKRAKGDGS